MTTSSPTGGDAGLGERFISSLAHELRSPLTVVVGYAELLRGRDDEAFREQASEQILRAAERLSFALDDLVTAYALDRDHLPVDVQPLDLEPAVRRALVTFAGNGSGRRIALSAPSAWPSVYADEEHLGRALVELLRIAWQRTPEGSEVEVAVSLDGESASIAVADAGPALSPEQIRTVFERPPARDPLPGGTGLELPNACRLVELQGGSISATSRRAGGSVFTITLPIADDPVR